MPVTYYGAIHETIARIDSDDCILFLQAKTNCWGAGDPAIAEVWKQLATGIDLDAAITAAAEGWVDRQVLSTDVERQLPDLVASGILTTEPPGRPSSLLSRIAAAGQPARRESAEAHPRPPARVRIVGGVGLVLALMLKALPLWWQLHLLAAVRRKRPARPGLEVSRQLAHAVTRAARYYPGWADCLEQATGAFLAGALLGAPPDLCIGGHLASDTYHAWVQAEHVAIDHIRQDEQASAMITV